jgi:hypothetical protein
MAIAITDITRPVANFKRVIPENVTLAIGQTTQFYLETLFSDGTTSQNIVSGMTCTGGVFTGPGLFFASAAGTWSVSYPGASSATVIIQSIGPTDNGPMVAAPAPVPSPPSIGSTPTTGFLPGAGTPILLTPTAPTIDSSNGDGFIDDGGGGGGGTGGGGTAPPPPLLPPSGSITPPTTPVNPPIIPIFTPPTTPTLDQFLYFTPAVVDVSYIKNSGLGIPSQTVQVGNNSTNQFLEVNFVNTPLVSITPATIGLAPGEVRNVSVTFTLTELTTLNEGLYTLGIRAEVRGPHL